MVQDWSREWYSRPQQTLIDQGKAAADCPHCGRGVILSNDISMAPSGLEPLERSPKAAQDWLDLLNDPRYPDVSSFLVSSRPDAQDYKDYTFRP